MKLLTRGALTALLLVLASTYSVATKDHELVLGKYSFLRKAARLQAAPKGAAVGHYGDTKCPCIGFDGLTGDTTIQLESGGQQLAVQYPKEVGARCEAWDLGRHPECLSGTSPDWCGKKWCFVDPCDCKIDIVPERAVHLQQASYRGHPVHYSYATCGAEHRMEEKHPRYGSPGCRCVGFEHAPGTIKVTLSGNEEFPELEYPASLGGTCKAWDMDRHPDCKGDNVPSWCRSRWCYVDACSCKLNDGNVPKISSYLPKQTFTGMAFYYSYETCGDEDTWTKKHHPTACVNQENEIECDANPRCAWTGKRCLGKELVHHPLCEDLIKRHKLFTYLKSGAARLAPLSFATALAAGAVAAVAMGRFD